MLDQVHQISEIIASLSIVASLIFVGLQVGQNTRALRSNTYQSNTETWQNIVMTLATNSDLLKAWKGDQRPEFDVLSEDEIRLGMFLSAMIKTMEFNYEQWLDGNLSDDLWLAAREGFVAQLELHPLYEKIWYGGMERQHSPKFRKMFEEIHEEAKANLRNAGISVDKGGPTNPSATAS
jgi:hypothetical protein